MAGNETEPGRAPFSTYLRETDATEYRDATLNLPIIDLEHGDSPFDPDPAYFELFRTQSEALAQAGKKYPDSDLYAQNELAPLVREDLDLSEEVAIAFSGGGSDALLDRFFTELFAREPVLGIGPHFANVVNFARKNRERRKMQGYSYYSSGNFVPLGVSQEEALYEITRRRSQMPRNLVIYLNRPGQPDGDVASLESVDMFTAKAFDYGDIVVIDEALGDVMKKTESAAQLVGYNPNVVVMRSTTKTLGVADGVGYVMMSKDVERKYKEVQRPVETRGIHILIAKTILDPEVMQRYTTNLVENKIKPIKQQLKEGLQELGLRVFRSDPRVHMMLVEGPEGVNLHDLIQLHGVLTTSGLAYQPTHPEIGMRHVRMRIPGDRSILPHLLLAIKASLQSKDRPRASRFENVRKY